MTGDKMELGTTAATTIQLIVVSCLLAGFGKAAAAQEPPAYLEDNSEVGEFMIVAGPIDLPAGGHQSSGEHGGAYVPIGTVTIPYDVYLYGFRYELVDGDGNVLPHTLLHHININDPDHRELFLPISRRMFAASAETGEMTVSRFLIGMPATKGQRWVVVAMLHNPTHQDYRQVSVRFYLPYVKTGRPWPIFKVLPFHIDVAFPAGHKAFDLPPGRHSWSWEGSPSIPGRIMAVSTHMHQYVERITLTNVTRNKLIWEGCPVHGPDGQVQGVTVGRLYRKLGTRISPEHRYRVSVTYNNPTADTLYDAGMGVVAGVFMPDNHREWPAVDRTDPLYQVDRAHYMREVEGKWAHLANAVPGGDEMERIARSPDNRSNGNGKGQCR